MNNNRITQDEGIAMLNLLIALHTTDELLTKLCNTTAYRHQMKLRVNHLIELIQPYIDDVAQLFSVCESDMLQLVYLHRDFCNVVVNNRPEDWQYVAATKAIVTNKEKVPLLYAQLKALYLTNNSQINELL